MQNSLPEELVRAVLVVELEMQMRSGKEEIMGCSFNPDMCTNHLIP